MKKIKLLQLLQLSNSPLKGHLYILPEVLSARLSNCFCKLYMLLCVWLFFFIYQYISKMTFSVFTIAWNFT